MYCRANHQQDWQASPDQQPDIFCPPGYTTITNSLVFVFENKSTYVCVYVDNILLINSQEIYLQALKNRLKKRFKIIDLKSILYYLEIAITRSNDRISLNQTTYLQAVLDRFEMLDCKTSSISINLGFANVVISSNKSYKVDIDIIF